MNNNSEKKIRSFCVTNLIGKLFSPFNANTVIKNIMNAPDFNTSKYAGMTSDEIKEKWKQITTDGSKFHKYIECYYKNADENLQNPCEEWNQFIEFDTKIKEKNWIPLSSEWKVELVNELENFVLRGIIDMTYTRETEDGKKELFICDWKRKPVLSEESTSKHAKFGLKQFPDNSLTLYSLQLNMYSYIIRQNISEYSKIFMSIVLFHPTNNKFVEYKVVTIPDETLEYIIQKITSQPSSKKKNLDSAACVPDK